METLKHYRICPLCEACCGLEIRTQGEKVVSIRGAEQDVFSRGYICPKGVSLKDLHEDPDRLRKPLIKRDGEFVEASWDEAFAEIERRLVPIRERHGADALALVIGNPSAHKIGLLAYVPRLVKALGTRNFFSASTLDQMPKQLSSGLMFGHWLSIPVPDIERCDFLLMLGANPMVSNGSLWTVPDYRGKAKAMRERGGRIVVVDPRRTETAAQADEHLAIRPGGDAFLLLGLVHTLFDEGLAKPGRLEEWTKGIAELREAVRPFAPERTAAACGIDAATQRRLARELAAAEHACVYGRLGTCTQRFGTLNSWLVDVLNILTGQLDAPGGAMFPKAAAFAANTAGTSGSGRGVKTARHASRVSGAPEVFGELPITLLAEEIETAGEGQVKALIAIAANPVLSAPNGPRIGRALDGLDFMLSLDIYLNETSRHADVILPGLSPLEDLHFDVAFPQLSYRNHARFSAPVFERPAGMPEEWQTLLRLAALFDPAATSSMPGPEALIDQALRNGPYGLTLEQVKAADGGVDLGALQPRIPELLRTPSGRIELAPTPLLAELPAVEQALAEATDNGLLLIGRRDVRSGNSWMHNLPVLAKGPERCTLLMHPQDAERLGLSNGATARLTAGGTELLAPVELTRDLRPGVVSLPHGWGHDLPGARLGRAAERPGINMNALLDDRLRDPLSGNAVLSGVAVAVEAA
ncbi:molybdopterin-dependent oxidoreductase [Paucibacter sp. R3-3]|uniref:Molybdopterin-dependent oxidoreductase n=1 Tax=Roseateles agri TaxID=3098619 RepID=A0ABU5DFJ4_9BURK|nr:molybdopterin-dependent oxidoreductase [Paucibacter sp. R3-3]MDY0744044.1 molybdopterin-dependent oxidoreductase [Paucibacter sp. R3-3]